jgi:hypothetical protein
MKARIEREDDLMAETRDALARCIPPIEFNSIEAGDFTLLLRRISALIEHRKNGKATLIAQPLQFSDVANSLIAN